MSDKKTPLDTIREALEAARIAMEGAHHGPHSFLPGQLRSWLEKRALALSALRSMEGSEPVDHNHHAWEDSSELDLAELAKASKAPIVVVPHPPAPAVVELTINHNGSIDNPWSIEQLGVGFYFKGDAERVVKALASKYHLIPKP